jgi:hypothetical protein
MRQTLASVKRSDNKVTKAVESINRTNPNIALTILKYAVNAIARESIRRPKQVCISSVHMNESLLHRPDPHTTIAVTEKSFRVKLPSSSRTRHQN